MIRPQPRSPLFPYTTLFRSHVPERSSRRRSESREAVAATREDHGSGDTQTRDRDAPEGLRRDRKSTRLNSSHLGISYAVFCLKKKKTSHDTPAVVRTRVGRK